MPNSYELVVLLDADAPTDTRTKIITDADALLKQHGEVKATKAWGVRQLPYLIDHHEQADYTLFRFETEPASIATLDRAFKLTEGVLRFRIFETETEGDLPEAPPLFKREERGYERPPREASATAELDEAPSDAEAAAEAPAEAAAEAAPTEAEAPAEAAAEPVAEAPAEAAPAEAEAEAPAEAPAE
ncbi:MAG: 30S ribosomal protein S6 [Thermoleophilaceae bacterium]|nr:30S ribosomal protein S6 [Thermoleophilaceae bacterium]